MIEIKLANNKTPTVDDPSCSVFGTLRYDFETREFQLVSADGKLIFDGTGPTRVGIHHKIKDAVVESPSAILTCKSNESARLLQDALVEAGFATDRPRFENQVYVWQGDGTI